MLLVEALGVSISMIDRRSVPSVHAVKTPRGQRLIRVAELDRFLREHLEPPRERAVAGRPSVLPRRAVERIRLECARERGFAEIARDLNARPDRAWRSPMVAVDGRGVPHALDAL
jgi:hypothetical protein